MSLNGLLERAGGSPARLLLAGGDAAPLRRAAARLTAAGLQSVQVVGDGGIGTSEHPRLESVATLLRSRAPERVRDAIDALDLAADPLRFALGLCALGEADAVVAGPEIGTTALVEATIWTLGPPPETGSFRFAAWLLLPDGRLVAFADCAPAEPLDSGGQQRLGAQVARLHARLTQEQPRIALLPGFRGDENVLIFPGGTSGSFALRIAKGLAGARLLGPLLLGSSGIVAGVAPDADEEELVGTAAATVLVAAGAGP